MYEKEKRARKLAYEEMGEINEKLYKPILEKTYGLLWKTSDKYARCDFQGQTYQGELKSRDLSIKEFSTTMIGYNKIEEAFKRIRWNDHIENFKFYFWFAFEEGLYAWEVNEENYELNGGDSMKKYAGTDKRGFNEYKDHYYIKIESLVKIDDTAPFIHPLVKKNNIEYSEKKKSVCWIKLSPNDLL